MHNSHSGSMLLSFDIEQRRALGAHTFAPLVAALRAELDPMIRGAIPIPETKARLTRIGGRCAIDGTLLAFDPWSPTEHHCSQCQRVYMGREHNDWWAMGAQLWVAERAVQSAAVSLITSEEQYEKLALRILTELAVRYRSYPNKDNALGPTRLFFSTYLESIWLINLCHAIALLESGNLSRRGRDILVQVRETLVQPSRDLIATFHEGRSNRQVWNEVAILSASRLLGDYASVEKRLEAASGLRSHFANGLLDDGTWYEGENYHLFAHRGLWYGVEFLRAIEQPLEPALEARYRAGFVTPFFGVLPDDTLPSRRDSQYAVSIRQWRFAEWCELGIAHSSRHQPRKKDQEDSEPASNVEDQLSGILHRLYDNSLSNHEARHRFSTADAERNERAGALSRADLSWRALFMAEAEIPAATTWLPSSVCLPRQGLAVIRRDEGRTYVALEGGHTGGGHGHPDRLALTLQHNRLRLLEDPGTGSYVERKLHWYRSTLAHAAPLVDGASQRPVSAKLVAFEDRGGAGWMSKRVENIAPGVNMQRTIVVADGYLIDLLEWDANRDCQIDLPVARHVENSNAGTWIPADPMGAGGLEDGFDFLTDIMVARSSLSVIELKLADHPIINASYSASAPMQFWRGEAPLPPSHGNGPLHWIRVNGTKGSIVGVWSWIPATAWFGDPDDGLIKVRTTEGTFARHSRTETGWLITLTAAGATSSIELGGVVSHSNAKAIDDDESPPSRDDTPTIELGNLTHVDSKLANLVGQPMMGAKFFRVGEQHYVQTEQDWKSAGEHVATVQVGVSTQSLVIDVLARTGTVVVPALTDENVLDNERRDVNSDGVQIHLGPDTESPWTHSWIVVPAPETNPNGRATPITPNTPQIESRWARMDDGWVLRCFIPLALVPAQEDRTFALEVIVNERSSDRQRRRGQLIISGGGGFGYLRGDRAEPSRAFTFRLPANTPA